MASRLTCPYARHLPQTVFWCGIALAGACAFVGCRSKSSRTRKSRAKQAVLDAMMPPNVYAANGEAIVVRLSKGFACVVPHMNQSGSGRYVVYYSPSGDFARDMELLEEGKGGGGGRRFDKWIGIKGHRIRFRWSMSASTRATLNDSDSTAAIALYEGDGPKRINVSQLSFQGNVEMDPKAMEQLLREEGVIP